MKIGIVGSRQYENRKKIKDTIFNLQKKFGSSLTIVSAGCKDGADRYAKKYALEFNCKYVEFNPAHTVYNFYSALNENYYGKAYSPKHFFVRNKMLAKYCDIVIGFIPDGVKSSGTINTITEAKKFNKKVVIIS
jgi:predicted Rossmann fold nucleotide-binding protein DprA/Smf involved in DNA uptake